jgi:hypothetical protein
VVVVVTGAGTEVCCVVVVSLALGLSVLQPVIERRPAAAMQERMIFFIFSFIVWFVYLQPYLCPPAGKRISGLTLPYTGDELKAGGAEIPHWLQGDRECNLMNRLRLKETEPPPVEYSKACFQNRYLGLAMESHQDI